MDATHFNCWVWNKEQGTRNKGSKIPIIWFNELWTYRKWKIEFLQDLVGRWGQEMNDAFSYINCYFCLKPHSSFWNQCRSSQEEIKLVSQRQFWKNEMNHFWDYVEWGHVLDSRLCCEHVTEQKTDHNIWPSHSVIGILGHIPIPRQCLGHVQIFPMNILSMNTSFQSERLELSIQ